MLTRYKLNFLLRILSLLMLSIIPSLYLFEKIEILKHELKTGGFYAYSI